LSDADTILLSDILPTSYMAVELADVSPDDAVAVFGCGPVGQLAIASLIKMGVKTIFAIDCVPSRLAIAKTQGAIPINFNKTDPVKELKKLTKNVGPTRVIDAVGIDAEQPRCTGIICWLKHRSQRKEFKRELKKVAPRQNPKGGNWVPGNGPSQALRWAVQSVAKYGTISIIGVYPDAADTFLIGDAMNHNLTIRMGNCNHRAYFPKLLDWVLDGSIDLKQFLTQQAHFDDIVEAYKHFDKRDDNWLKVMIKVS
jgi:threonine dehydrogenase-like Zn-dependent dehydrogenase